MALIHGPPETHYIRLSEPMVNIRATLERAVKEAIVERSAIDGLLAEAKKQFYQDRNWPALLAKMDDPAAAAAFSAWLRTGHVDQKRDDALLMLDAVKAFLDRGVPPDPASFSFEWTENWHNAPWRTEGRSAQGNV